MVRIAVAIILAVLVAVRVGPGGGVEDSVGQAQAAPSAACVASGILGGAAGAALGCGGAGSAVRGAISDAAGSGFKAVAKSFAQGWATVIGLALAWFIKIPTPDYSNDSVIQAIQKATVQIQLYGLALSILVGSYRLIMARRNAVMNAAEESFMGLAKAVFGAWMFGGVLTACTAGSDALANWMLTKGMQGNENLIRNLASANLVAMGSGLIVVVAICGILGGILQAVLLVGRQAMLAVVVATIPVVGSFGGTQTGKAAFGRLIQWTIALLLWKPVAALVYWVAFKMAAHPGTALQDVQMALMGMILLSLTALVMPILIKLVAGGQAMSGGSGLTAGMMTAGVVAAAGTMAATGGAGAAAGGGSTAGQAGAQMGPMAGPTGSSGPSGGTGGGGGGTGTAGPSGTGGSGSPAGGGAGGSGRSGGGTGSSSGATPPPGGGPVPAGGGYGATQASSSGSSSGSGSGSGGSINTGDVAQAASAAMSSADEVFDDGYESSAPVGSAGGYR